MSGVVTYSTTDNPAVHEHARENWEERAPDAEVAIDTAWRQAVSVRWPGVFNGTYARYHEATEIVLAARRQTIFVVWPIAFLDEADREWVLEDVRQARATGGSPA